MIVKEVLAALIILLVLCNTAKASDTLLYKSDFEQRIINNAIQNKTVDFIALFSAIDTDSLSSLKYISRLNNFYFSIEKQISNAHSSKQKTKILFKEVHGYFFKKYEENVRFSKIFEEGIYNCLTASMLYSLVLKKYNIPFEVKEKPSHIYIVALPETENILFETTSPTGFYVPDEKMRRQYVSALVDMKLITQDYVNSVGIAKAFAESYYNNNNITLTQLAGLQYFNEAIDYYDSKNATNSIMSTIKANMLYPCPKILFLKSSLIGETLVNSNFDALQDILYLTEYANSTKEVKDRKFVLSTFRSIIDDKLIKNGDDLFLTKAFKILQTGIKDSVIMEDISYNYYHAMAYWRSTKGSWDDVLTNAEKAYKINQKDARLQEMIIRAIGYKTDKFKGKENSIVILNAYMKKFPFLENHQTFKSILVYLYSFQSYNFFRQNSSEEGCKYLALMEQVLASTDDHINEVMIGMVYAEAGAFYYRKQQYQKSKEILLKGLKLYPDHSELKERLKIVESELRTQKIITR